MSRSLRIVAADEDRHMRDYYRELLPRLGHEALVAGGGRQLVELCQALAPDLVIADVKLKDLNGLTVSEALGRERPTPLVLVSAHHDAAVRQQALRDYVMAYLVKPVKQADLETAIDLAMMRFEQFQALRREVADLRQALEDRKVIEQAKGVVMKRAGVDEREAFARLQRQAVRHARKLIDIANLILEVETAFAPSGEPRPG